MMYETGVGVEQNFVEAGKWFLTSAEAGDLRSGTHYSGELRTPESNLRRETELSARWTKLIAKYPALGPPPRAPRTQPAPAPAISK